MPFASKSSTVISDNSKVWEMTKEDSSLKAGVSSPDMNLIGIYEC